MANNLVKIFEYNGNPIPFIVENGAVMINATEMARRNGKQIAHWFNNPSTFEYFAMYGEQKLGIRPIAENPSSLNASKLQELYPEMIKVVKGGIDPQSQGTWLVEDIALEAARWINAKFAIWCNDRIKELMHTGITTVANIDDIIANPDAAIKMLNALKAERERNKALEEEKQKMQLDIEKKEKELVYYNQILTSKNTVTITQIAQDYGKSAIELNCLLEKMRVQRKVNGQWILYSKFLDGGFVASETIQIQHNDGSYESKMITKWTQRGRLFLYDELKKRGIIPTIEDKSLFNNY